MRSQSGSAKKRLRRIQSTALLDQTQQASAAAPSQSSSPPTAAKSKPKKKQKPAEAPEHSEPSCKKKV